MQTPCKDGICRSSNIPTTHHSIIMRCCGHDFSFLSVVIDVITIAPFAVWLIVSVAAIYLYAGLAWYGPIACAVTTTAICGVATVHMWRRAHTRAVIYLVIEGPMAGGTKKAAKRCITRCDTWIALLCLMLCVIWAVLCVVANSSIRRIPQPCPGLCGSWGGGICRPECGQCWHMAYELTSRCLQCKCNGICHSMPWHIP